MWAREYMWMWRGLLAGWFDGEDSLVFGGNGGGGGTGNGREKGGGGYYLAFELDFLFILGCDVLD